jgi:hypothetical protein
LFQAAPAARLERPARSAGIRHKTRIGHEKHEKHKKKKAEKSENRENRELKSTRTTRVIKRAVLISEL